MTIARIFLISGRMVMTRQLFALGLVLGISASAVAQYPGQPPEKKSGLVDRVFSNGPATKYTPEEMQLQAYWANYYRGLANYYASLNNVDWVAYYKANGYPIDPRFYNPYNVAPGATMVPMQPMMAQGMPQPVMVPPSKMANGVVQVGAVEVPAKADPKMEKSEKSTKGSAVKSSSRR
jgi:hypothetical protein